MSRSSPAPGRASATGTTARTNSGDAVGARRCWSRMTASTGSAPGDLAAWPKGSTQRPSSDQRQRRRRAVSSSFGGGTQYRRRLFRHRHDVHRRRPLRPQGRLAFQRAIRQRLSYCSMTHGSSCAWSIHSLDMGVRQHRLHIGCGERRDGHAIGDEAGHHRRVHDVGRAPIAEQEFAGAAEARAGLGPQIAGSGRCRP